MRKRSAGLGALGLLATGLLAACTTPSQRIAARLVDYGVPPHQAECMGDRLASRLTTAQLRQLAAIAQAAQTHPRQLSIDQIAHAIDDPRDPALVREVVKAGVACLI